MEGRGGVGVAERTRSLMTASVLASAEGPIAELALVFPLWYENGLP